jgi:hypothetical protein
VVLTKRWSEAASSVLSLPSSQSSRKASSFAEFDGVGGVQTQVVRRHVQPSGAMRRAG